VNTAQHQLEQPLLDVESDEDEDQDLEVDRNEVLELFNGKETLRVVKGAGINDPKVLRKNVLKDDAWIESEAYQETVVEEIVTRYVSIIGIFSFSRTSMLTSGRRLKTIRPLGSRSWTVLKKSTQASKPPKAHPTNYTHVFWEN
jgi:hypothetical protein